MYVWMEPGNNRLRADSNGGANSPGTNVFRIDAVATEEDHEYYTFLCHENDRYVEDLYRSPYLLGAWEETQRKPDTWFEILRDRDGSYLLWNLRRRNFVHVDHSYVHWLLPSDDGPINDWYRFDLLPSKPLPVNPLTIESPPAD